MSDLVFSPPSLPEYAVPVPIDWGADPHALRGWRVVFQSLSWLDWIYDPEVGNYGAAEYVVVDWAERALFADPPLELTWDPHAVAARLGRVWRFLANYVENSPVVNVRVVHAAVAVVLTHLYALTIEDCYDARHNHGFMQDVALLTHAGQLASLRDREALMDLAEARLVEQVSVAVTEDGIHWENSPHYHVMFTKVLSALLTRFYSEGGREPPALLRTTRDALLSSLVHLLQPDVTVPQFGDSLDLHRGRELRLLVEEASSSRFSVEPEVLEQLRFVRSGGSSGTPPAQTSRVWRQGGYAAFRSGWFEEAVESAIVAHFTCNRLTPVHYQRDETSFEIFGYGQPLLVDSGRYNNDRTVPLVSYQASAAAHNVLMVDGNDFSVDGGESGIIESSVGSELSWVQGRHAHYSALGIPWVTRTFAHLVPSSFIVVDSARGTGRHRYQQIFRFHPSLSELSFPDDRTVAAHDPSTGVSIILTATQRPDDVVIWRGEDSPHGSWYFPEENVSLATSAVVFEYEREGHVDLAALVRVFGRDEQAPTTIFATNSTYERNISIRWMDSNGSRPREVELPLPDL